MVDILCSVIQVCIVSQRIQAHSQLFNIAACNIENLGMGLGMRLGCGCKEQENMCTFCQLFRLHVSIVFLGILYIL